MKVTVLDKLSLGLDLPFEILDEIGEVKFYDATAQKEVVDHIGDSDVILINKVKITESVMEKCKNLKLICI